MRRSARAVSSPPSATTFRTPANAISLLAELIRRSAQDPAQTGEIPEIAHELRRCSASLVNFVSDVLDLTRLDLGRFELHESDFEFNQCLSDAFHQLQPLAGGKNLEFVCNPFPTAVRLHADRIKLSRVLTNLMGNAIKYTERGRVCVSAERLPDGCIRVSVSDTGIGIAPENLSAIFDEFAQLKNPDRAKSTGSGLGIIHFQTTRWNHGRQAGSGQPDRQGKQFLLHVARIVRD